MLSLSNKEKLEYVYANLKDCTRCQLGRTRNKIVFGEGNAQSPVLFIGEGPGREEDLQGKPFVGRSGQLLSEIIYEVFQWDRNNYYITNIVKCRPTTDLLMIKDRPPEKTEIEACRPLLFMQLEIIQPRVIVAIGSSAAKSLLNTETGITSIRGKWHDFMKIPLMPIFHPSYVLRNGGRVSAQYQMMKSDLEVIKLFLSRK